jgi:hypothetical protein
MNPQWNTLTLRINARTREYPDYNIVLLVVRVRSGLLKILQGNPSFANPFEPASEKTSWAANIGNLLGE